MSKSTSTIPEGIVDELDRLGFKYREDPAYDLSQLHSRVQVRTVKNVAPKKEVARYAEAMHYSAFPPIIVTEDEALIEGNTRVEAYALNKTPTCWAIVVNAKQSDPDATVQARLHALAVGLNNQNGRAHSDAENRDAAALAAKAGWKVEEIAKTLKVAPRTASEIVREVAAEQKLEALGVSANGGLAKKQLRALGAPKLIDLNNEPFKGLATLARDAGLNVTEIRQLASTMKEAGSDPAALAVLDTKRDELKDRITQKNLTGTVKPTPATQLRKALGNVTKYESNPEALVEHGPDYKDSHIEVVERSIAILQAVLAVQHATG